MHLPKACEIAAGLTVSLFTCMSYSHVLTHGGIRSVSDPKPEYFIDNVFDMYSTNNSINLREFKELLKSLHCGVTSDKTARKSESSEEGTSNYNSDFKCYPAKTLFESYSIGSDGLDKTEFEKICPAIVQQVGSGACVEEGDAEEDETIQSKAQAWGYGFLSVTIISCASLLGAFVVPFMNQSFYRVLLLFMVSLAVGVLCGSGIFHLVPYAFHLGYLPDGSYDYSYLWKCLTIVVGVYLFFFLEYIMKMIVRFKEKAIANEEHGLENVGAKTEIPGAAIADVQLQLYNTTKVDHPHVHENMFFVNPKLSHKSTDPHVVVHRPSQENGTTKNKVAKNHEEKKQVAPVAWMIIVGDGLHNFIDGLAIGASFSGSTYVGISTALAIFCEELPHELGDFAVLLNAGMSYRRAMAFNFLSACVCYLGLVIGLLLGYTTSAVSWIYALAGGMFIYISLVDMLEEATEMSVKLGAESICKNLKTFALQNFGIITGFTVMFILAQYGSYITVE